jgi:hypothetical protein
MKEKKAWIGNVRYKRNKITPQKSTLIRSAAQALKPSVTVPSTQARKGAFEKGDDTRLWGLRGSSQSWSYLWFFNPITRRCG